MAYTSFSLSAWVRANSFRNGCWMCCQGDNAIFGQHDQQTTDRSLHIIVRTQTIYLGFYADDVQGSLVLQPHVWYHVREDLTLLPVIVVLIISRWPIYTIIQAEHNLFM